MSGVYGSMDYDRVKKALNSDPVGVYGGVDYDRLASAVFQSYFARKPYDALVFLDDQGRSVAIDSKGQKIAGPSTDHASVIQRAIENMQDGGTIFLHGSFNIDKTIVINKPVVLLGSGKNATKLVQVSDVDVIKLEGQGSWGTIIKHLTITSSITPASGRGIVINGSSYNIIEDVEIEKVYIGIYIYGDSTPLYSYFNTFMNVNIHDCISHGIYIDGETAYTRINTFINVRSTQNGGDGFRMEDTDEFTIIGGEAYNNGGYGVYIGSGALNYHISTHLEANSAGDTNLGTYSRGLTLGFSQGLVISDQRYSNRYLQLVFNGFYNRAYFKVSGATIMELGADGVKKTGLPLLSDCANLPASGDYTGETIVCYDTGLAKWVLKVWDGSVWQTIG